jgi:flagellar basal-body rod protein FlgF
MPVQIQSFAMQNTPKLMMSAQSLQSALLEETAHNLSATSVYGFKAIKSKIDDIVTRNPDGSKSSFVKITAIQRDLSNGSLQFTSSPLDFSITDNGYFMVSTPNGVRYTRNGQFRTNEQGVLVTGHGYPVLDEGGSEITIKGSLNNFTVSGDGSFSMNGTNSGKIGIVTFANQQAMSHEGSSLLSTDQDAVPSANFKLTQGALEESNVSVMESAIKLMEIQKRYESAQAAIQQLHDSSTKINNLSRM